MTNYILKPCPYCGSKNVKIHHNKSTAPFCIIGVPNSYVKCEECGVETEPIDASVEYCADEKAVEAWNLRKYVVS